MYIFAEPATEEAVAAIQSQNAAKIEEFERNILGLKREIQSEGRLDQEDEGKWDNIQASVEKAMEEDELSIDGPKNNQESGIDNTEESESTTPHDILERDQAIAEDEPLEANKKSEAAIASDEADEAEDRDEIEDDQALEPSADCEGSGLEEHHDAMDPVDSDEENRIQQDSEVEEDDADDSDLGEYANDKSAVIDDSANKILETSKSATGNGQDGHVLESDATEVPEDSTTDETNHEVKQQSSPNTGTEDTKKAADTIPAPEKAAAENHSEADQAIPTTTQETKQADSGPSSSGDILAMTLTLRNKVNNQYVQRPTSFTEKDAWSIEYSLLEVPSQERAKVLYEACQKRRKKKLDDQRVPEDADTVSAYLANLRRLSKSGRKWRKALDEEESKTAAEVLD